MKNYLLLFALVYFGNSLAAETIQPRVIHNKQQFSNQVYNDDYLRIVLKFHDGSGVRSNARGGLEIRPELQDATKLRQRGLSPRQVSNDTLAINRYISRLQLKSYPLIEGKESDFKQEKEQAEQYWQQELAELPTYQQLLLKDGGHDPQLPIWVRTMNTFPSLEIAYAEPVALPPLNDSLVSNPIPLASCNAVPIDPDAGDFSGLQGYFGAPPIGMNADILNQVPGGQGTGIRIIDVEGGYVPHSDHKSLFQLIGATKFNSEFSMHGNIVIGIIGALQNGIGLNGLSAEASIGLRSIYNYNLFDDWASAIASSANTAHHLYWAAKHSMQGVVLIELQRHSAPGTDCVCNLNNSGCTNTPLEYWAADFDTIKTATGNGVIFVEPAGNGSRNLDSPMFNTCSEGHCFDRSIRNSGAIFVTGSQTDGVTPICENGNMPSHGSRIDVHSWGSMIPNTGGNTLFDRIEQCNDYDEDFGNTSGASAIIAGAVTSLQGAYFAATGSRLDALSMIEALTATGTPQAPMNVGGQDFLIGSHPNLTEALQYALDQLQ